MSDPIEEADNKQTERANIDIENIGHKLSTSYLDYAYSVIIGRALPDVRDGLKPVQRRIIYSMYDNRFTFNNPHKKCARIVGDVLGRYHPHGESSIYSALVRMGQDFSLRYPLIGKQGNFGSLDGDEPAAMRYTEARLSQISGELVADIEKETVNFIPNFDESLLEPYSLPSKIPNILINGSSGIAVGMRTYMPPYNLREVISATRAVIDNPNIYPEEISNYIKGPDFPTKGIIVGRSGIRQIINTGRGKITVRGRMDIEDNGKKQYLIITEIPYQVNKASLVESIANLVNNKKLIGVTDLTDESARGKVRIVVEIRHDTDANAIKHRICKLTTLETSISVINLVLVNNAKQPVVLNILGIIKEFIAYREEIIRKRTAFDLKNAQKRLHIIEGLIIAITNIDEVVKIIRGSVDVPTARTSLINEFSLTEIQANQILDMPLRRLTALQVQKLDEELLSVKEDIIEYESILADRNKRMEIIKSELEEIDKKYGDDRKTEIIEAEEETDVESLIKTIPEEMCVIILTENQYIKRMTLKTYESQRRGGKGKKGITAREEDIIRDLFVLSSHDKVLMFTKKGRVYNKYAYEFPLMTRTSKGKALVNFMGLKPGEKVVHIIPISDFTATSSLIFCTKNGIVKKTLLKKYKANRITSVKAITLRKGDELISVKLSEGENHIMIASKNGYAIKFSETDLRPIGRSAMGVKGITLREGDEVVDMVIGSDDIEIISITNRGYGKRSKLELYRKTRRGGKGVINIKFRHGDDGVNAVKSATDEDLLIVTTSGMVIRVPSVSLRTLSRSAKGVRVINLKEDDFVSSVALCEASCEEELTAENDSEEEPQEP